MTGAFERARGGSGTRRRVKYDGMLAALGTAELADGESLASVLREGPLPVQSACEIAAQLCEALAQAHAQRLVHRDIKPANVLISAHGQVKLADFGVARLVDGSSDGSAGTVVG